MRYLPEPGAFFIITRSMSADECVAGRNSYYMFIGKKHFHVGSVGRVETAYFNMDGHLAYFDATFMERGMPVASRVADSEMIFFGAPGDLDCIFSDVSSQGHPDYIGFLHNEALRDFGALSSLGWRAYAHD